MPFQSEKQRRYLWANEPEIARDWADTYGSRIKKDDGGIMDVPRRRYFSGAYGQGAGDRGGDPHASAAQNIASGHVTGNEAQQVKERYNITKKDVRTAKKENKQRRRDIKTTRKAEALQNKKKQAFVKYLQKDWNQNPHMDPEEVADMLQSQFGVTTNPDGTKSYNFDGDAIDTGFQKGTKYNMPTDTQLGPFGLSETGAKGKKLGTKYIDRTPDFSTKITMPIALQALGLGKPNYNTLLSTYNRMNTLGGIKTQKDWNNYWDDVRATHKTDHRDGPKPYLPILPQGGTEVAEVVEDTPSAFQASLTGTADTPDYYVGDNPLASNLAWGEKFGVDPRTMGRTSWAADGGRIGRAYGGIMDTDTGRRAYGLGSIFSKIGKAAKKVLKSPIGKAALIGAGAYFGPQMLGAGSAGFGQWKNVPFLKSALQKGVANKSKSGWLRNIFSGGKGYEGGWNPWKIGIGALGALPFFMGGKDDDEDEGFDYEGAKNKYWDELMRIKAGAMAGTLDPTKFRYQGVKDGGRIGMYAGGQSTPSDYTMEDAMMTTTQDKLGGITDVMKQADLSRQGSVGQFYAAHGGSADDNNARLEARVKELQDEGLDFNSAMAQAMKELSSGKAQGGRIGYAGGSGSPPITLGQNIQAPGRTPPPPPRPHPMPAPQPNRMAGMPGGMNPMMNRPMMNPMMGGMHPMMNRPMMNPMMRGNPMMGGRRMAQEGGLMDLGGMEKDYRNDGGFVPLGGEEKADDVPARLSKNEFVFTADAVRGAGDGDIDKGAEIMENIMKNLEQGGQISEETQGLSGAQEMFGVSERLGEVL